jgi:basic membrane protein A and related proteins
MRKSLTVLLILAVLVAALPTALAQDETAEPVTVKVALILPGRADDVSWNQAAYDGMLSAVDKVAEAGIEVDLTTVEEVYDPVDIEPALLDYAQQGYDLVVGHGFQFMEPIVKVAEDYPDVNFAIGTGYKIAPNVGVYDVKLEQGGYLMGLIAGYLTEAGIVGVTGGVDVSEIHRGHVAFLLGAEEANPDVTVLSNFTGDFNDVPAAKEAALSQIAAGADVLWQSGDGIGFGVLSACEEKDIICMGNVADQNEIAPDNTLASFVYDWAPLFVQMIEETVDGTYGDKFYWNDFSNEGVSIVWNAPLQEKLVDDTLTTMLDDAIAGFVDGTLDLGDLDAYELN